MAVGYWESTDDVVANWQEGKRWTPTMEPAERDRTYRLWKKAVTRTHGLGGRRREVIAFLTEGRGRGCASGPGLAMCGAG